MKPSTVLRLAACAALASGLSLRAEEPTPAPSAAPTPPSVKAGIGVGRVAFEQKGAIKVADLVSGRIDSYDLPERMEGPAWGPDGQKFLYNSDFGLSLLDIQGQTFTGLTPTSVKAQHAAWNGDGTLGAYDTATGDVGLFVYSFADKKSTKVPLAVPASRPAFHPGGAHLLFTAPVAGVEQIFSLPLACLKDGGCDQAAIQLTKAAQPSRGGAFSADGAWIAFEREEAGGSAIYVMKSDGTAAKRLSPAGAHDRHPSWGGSERLAFEREDAQGGRSIHLMKADGSDVQELVADAVSPAWWVPKK